eukprot:NODE_43_length_33755_cov_1.178542.p9 type:complete len:371 gc:universal NODE_43_length_33755_cov_1.178542:26778-27890(+)
MKVVVSYKGTKYSFDVAGNTIGKDFKQKVFERTELQVERQKLLVKGKKIEDDTNLNDILQEGSVIFLMGSNATIAAPKPVEKMESDKPSSKKISLPVGLKNLGNTCYLNATIQCFKLVPELVDGLNLANPTLQLLFKEMDKNVEKQEPVNPIVFYTLFKTEFPQFSQTQTVSTGMGNVQTNAQQDASESWSQLLESFFRKNPKLEDLFRIQLLETHKSEESPSETSVKTIFESMMKININQTTTYLEAGIKDSLHSHLEKRSDVLNKQIQFQTTSQFASLPRYLNVNLVRFYWKQPSNVKAKILKSVKFPFVLDLYDHCTDEYKNIIKDSRVNALKDNLSSEGEVSGVYDLVGVLTHIGRSSDSGHCTLK